MINRLFKRLIPRRAKKTLREKLGVPSQEISLNKIRALGFAPRLCLDIGAYEGQWAIEFKKIFPECAIMMFEGQASKEPVLAKVQNTYKDISYKIALLGASDAPVAFNMYETASSVLQEHHATNAQTETMNLNRLDDLLAGSPFNKPDFIKIDTQGYELEILKGGGETLSQAEFVLLEVSFLDIYVNCPLVAETIDFMKARGFVVYDICTLMHRPLDKALFQSDFLFIREGSPFRRDKRWI